MYEEFAKRMAILSKLSQFEMEPEILELYWRYLEDLGPILILEALEEAILDTGSKNMFPSAKKLRSYVDNNLTVEDRADLMARNIARLVGTHGYNWPQKDPNWPSEPIKELGPDGWDVIQRIGGWAKVHQECCVTENASFHAQIKKTAIATLKILEKETRDANRLSLSSGPEGRNLLAHVPEGGKHE